MVNPRDIRWLAGLLEGEASFQSRPENKQPRIDLQMTDEDVVAKAASILGVKHSYCRKPYVTRTGKLTKPAYRTMVDARKAAAWMMTLYSLMGERRKEQIKRALDAWKGRKVAFIDALGREQVKDYSRLTHCKHGHEIKGSNAMFAAKNKRGQTRVRCRICYLAYHKNYYHAYERSRKRKVADHPGLFE